MFLLLVLSGGMSIEVEFFRHSESCPVTNRVYYWAGGVNSGYFLRIDILYS